MSKGNRNPDTQYPHYRGSERQTVLGSFLQNPLKSAEKFKPRLIEEMNNRLKEHNSRDADQVKQHLKTIKQAISSDIEGSIDLKFGGSVLKNTYVEGLSDNDILVFLNRSELRNTSPSQALELFANRLRQRLPNSEINTGNLAVTIKFRSSNTEIQLLPAIKTKTGMRIADPQTGKWSNVVKPQKFAKELTTVNQQNDGQVVPVIKTVKPIISASPKNQQITGYHTEALATEMFKQYTGPKNVPDMVNFFFKQASRRILYPIKEKTGQSEYVDDKLGMRGSFRRRIISKAFEEIDYRMETASEKGSLREWRNILDGR